MTTQRLTIVAQIQVKPAHKETVKAALLKLIATTRSEPGCINYDLHQDNEDENLFLFHENWKNRDLWQTHMQNDHLVAYMEETEGMIERFTLNEMTQIG